MEELKTLKDFEGWACNAYCDCGYTIPDELRQEAIKWYKALKEENEENTLQVRLFIMNFFNLKKEDLK